MKMTKAWLAAMWLAGVIVSTSFAEQPADVGPAAKGEHSEQSRSAEKSPFYVFGRVVDEHGKPLVGATVRAATGYGTLLGGNRTTTDNEGRYRLHFGPGLWVMEDYAPLNVGVQAAIISASKDGRAESNLSRQGNLLMSDQSPEKLAEELKRDGRIWDRTSLDQIVFPDKPREVDFTLVPAASIEGTLRNGSRALDEMEIVLTGEQLPPGCSALASVATDDDGNFQIADVQVGVPWRFAMRVAGSWEEIETEDFTIDAAGVYRCELQLDAQRNNDRSVTISLHQKPL
jgi:hypothetical protein